MTRLPSPPGRRVVSTVTGLVLYSEARSSFHRGIGTCAPILVTFVFFIVRKISISQPNVMIPGFFGW